MDKPRLDKGPDYERGFIDGMQHQMQSSVDKAVNRMAQPDQDGKCKYCTDGCPACDASKLPEQKSVAMADYMALTEKYVALKAAQPEQKPMHPQLKAMLEEYFDKCFAESSPQRNQVLEEVAKRFDAMPFGDTSASFARYVRDMKT